MIYLGTFANFVDPYLIISMLSDSKERIYPCLLTNYNLIQPIVVTLSTHNLKIRSFYYLEREQNPSIFDNVDVRNIIVMLNSTRYPNLITISLFPNSNTVRYMVMPLHLDASLSELADWYLPKYHSP